MFARRMSALSSGTAQDVVVMGMSLPSDSVVHAVNGEVHLWGTTVQAQNISAMYAFEGYLLPVLDPDAAVGYDTLWDTLVPKDTDVESIDLDTGAADTAPFYEPGEPDFTKLFDIGLQPERIFRRHRIMTIANGSVMTTRDPATPFAVEWVPGDHFKINIRKKYRVRQPSVMLFALAMPALDDTTSTVASAAAEA